MEITNEKITMDITTKFSIPTVQLSNALDIDYDDIIIENSSSDIKRVTIVSSSEQCEIIRDEGDFFYTIACALDIARDAITEID